MTGRPPGVLTPLRGYTIACSVPDCRQETAEQAPSRSWRTPDRAVLAAKALGWIHAPDETGAQAWYCPTHQAWDPRTSRWAAAPPTTDIALPHTSPTPSHRPSVPSLTAERGQSGTLTRRTDPEPAERRTP